MAAEREALFLEGSVPRALLSLALPVILANLLQTGFQLTDAFWVGGLGAAVVAAISVSFPVTFLVVVLGSGLAMAGATITAQYGSRQDMVNHVAPQTMPMVAITSVFDAPYACTTSSTILPTCELDSISACACAASASGNVL